MFFNHLLLYLPSVAPSPEIWVCAGSDRGEMTTQNSILMRG